MLGEKLLLSHVRGGDYAHPGEVAAIDQVLQLLDNDKSQSVLDVGCGLGGTARYIQQQGYQDVTAIDIDGRGINYAKKNYPLIKFFECDVVNAEKILMEKFNIIVLFSAFFCFKAQQESLSVMGNLAHPGADLMLFDYFALENYVDENPFSDDTSKPFYPIHRKTITDMLDASGWDLKNIIDLTEDFKIWYTQMICKLEAQKFSLIYRFEEGIFNTIYHRFKRLFSCIEQRKIGGVLIHAQKR